MTRQSISFTPPNNDWLRSQVESEEFRSKSDVINDLIRKARQQHDEIELIRAKLIAAEQGGLSERSPQQIREATKASLKKNA